MRRFALAITIAAILAGPSWGQDKKTPVTGANVPELAALDEMMLKALADHQVPGAALAVTKDGRLIYARGFGLADRQLGLPVQPSTRFRIASISKPISAAMILRVVELGLLKLDDNPFRFLQLALPEAADPRLKKVTIKHLLQHTGGWDSEKSFDPMFRSVGIAKAQKVEPPAKAIDILRYMMNVKLDFEPGERYAYCNFGYCILGRVIEKATGQSYEAAVTKQILEPLAIKDMQLGRTLTTAKNETRYFDEKNRQYRAVVGPDFGKPVALPYGAWYLEAMDAHGGWIASAPDLLRFACAFEDPARSKVLKEATVQSMFARPDGLPGHDKDGKPKDIYYGFGWQVFRKADSREYICWHAGALDGTSTELVRRKDGLSWVVLFNTRKNANGDELNELIVPLVHAAMGKVKQWPPGNLFEARN